MTSAPLQLAPVVLRGVVAGALGVAAMTAAEQVEQRITRRPDSFVPAHTLERLLMRPRKRDRDRVGMNWAMHWGTGMLLGAIRGLMAANGVRGPFGALILLNARLLTDQTAENLTGVGAVPWTWPRSEQAIDRLHKGLYAVVTGVCADRWIEHR